MRRGLLCLTLVFAAGAAMPAILTSSRVWAEPVDTATYVQKAAVGDLFEIETSRLAETKASNAKVKTFAEMMVADHTQSSQKIAAAAGTTLPKLDQPHQDQLAQLRKVSGAEFDRSYIELQVKTHTDALQLHQEYATNGSDPKLKAVAAEIVPVVSHHLDEAKSLAGAS